MFLPWLFADSFLNYKQMNLAFPDSVASFLMASWMYASRVPWDPDDTGCDPYLSGIGRLACARQSWFSQGS